MRLHPPAGGLAPPIRVAEGNDLQIPATRGEHGQYDGIYQRNPFLRDGLGRSHGGHGRPQPGRKHLLQLRQRAHRTVLKTPADRDQPDRHGNGFVIVEEERRHVLPRSQPVPAGGPGRPRHRVVERTQPLDVTPYGPVGDAEALGQLVAGPFAPALQQGEQPK